MAKTAKAPDYTAAAEATGQSSKEVTNMQTWANRPDQVTPYGTTSWNSSAQVDPSTGQNVTKWTQNTTLTPESQKALEDQFAITSGRSDLARQLLPRAAEEYGQKMDWSNFGQLADAPEAQSYNPNQLQRSINTDGMQQVDPSQRYYSEAGDALMNQFDSRANPKNQADQAALETQLRTRGMNPGDKGYDAELAKLRTQQSDARTNASFQASQLAGQEAARMYGMDSSTRSQQFGEAQNQGNFANTAAGQDLAQQLQIGQQEYGQQTSSANYQNQLRQQQIAEAMQQRGFSLNEINALISGQQVGMPSMPTFNQATKSETVDYSGAAQSQYQAAQAAADSQNAMTQGLMSAAAGAIPS